MRDFGECSARNREVGTEEPRADSIVGRWSSFELVRAWVPATRADAGGWCACGGDFLAGVPLDEVAPAEPGPALRALAEPPVGGAEVRTFG